MAEWTVRLAPPDSPDREAAIAVSEAVYPDSGQRVRDAPVCMVAVNEEGVVAAFTAGMVYHVEYPIHTGDALFVTVEATHPDFQRQGAMWAIHNWYYDESGDSICRDRAMVGTVPGAVLDVIRAGEDRRAAAKGWTGKKGPVNDKVIAPRPYHHVQKIDDDLYAVCSLPVPEKK